MNNTLRQFFQSKKEDYQKNSNMSDKDKYQWHIEYLVQYLQSPEWIYSINNFIDENCILFEDIQENFQEYNIIFKKFQNLLDQNLTVFAKDELKVTDSEFTQLIDIGLQNEEYADTEDFLQFKQIMLQRNLQIENEAMVQYLLNIKESAEEHNLDEQELERAIALSLNIQNQFSENSEDEDEQMQRAILESQKDFLAQQKPQFEEKKIVKGKKLDSLDTPVTVIKQQEIDTLMSEREKLIKQLQKAEQKDSVQKEMIQLEDKEERKKRLQDQRNIIIQQKKQQREQNLDEVCCEGEEKKQKKVQRNLICDDNEQKFTAEEIQKLEHHRKIIQKIQQQL